MAQVKMKTLCSNNNPYMNKSLRNALMTRSRLKSKFDKNTSIENWNI